MHFSIIYLSAKQQFEVFLFVSVNMCGRFVSDQNIFTWFHLTLPHFVIQWKDTPFLKSTDAYVINVCGERCQVLKLGEIELDLWEKLKLALYADFLIVCISLRYCLCVSKCTLIHKSCSLSIFFDNPYCAYGQRL